MVIKFYREIIIGVLLLVILGLFAYHYKEVNKKDAEYATLLKEKNDLVINYLDASNKANADLISKLNTYNNNVNKMQENYNEKINQIAIDRNNLNAGIDSLSKKLKAVNNSNAASNNSEPTSSISGGSQVPELFVMCASRYSDMGAEADKLRASVKTYNEMWKELQETYKEKAK